MGSMVEGIRNCRLDVGLRRATRDLGAAADADRRFARAGDLAGVRYTNHISCDLAVLEVEFDQQSLRMFVAMTVML
jgi:hypothetical protein